MSNDTMTFPQVLRAMAENVESGRGEMHGIEVYRDLDRKWVSAHPGDIAALRSYCNMGSVRKAPSYIEVAGIQVPEPMRKAPEEGVWYWYEDDRGVEVQAKWTGNFADRQRLQQGNVFESVSGPEARAKAERLLFGVDSTTNNE